MDLARTWPQASCLEMEGLEQPLAHLSLSSLVLQTPPGHWPGGCVAVGGRLSLDTPGKCGFLPSLPSAPPLASRQVEKGTWPALDLKTAGPVYWVVLWALGGHRMTQSSPSSGSDGQASMTLGDQVGEGASMSPGDQVGGGPP